MSKDSKRKKKIAIIGAGPAGITAAYVLSRDSDHEISVFESGHEVGGMAKSIKIWDQIVDIGPHRFFSQDDRINNLWKEVIGEDYSVVNRKTRIFTQGKFFDYPISITNVLKNMSIPQTARMGFSYFLTKTTKLFNKKKIENFEEWVTDRFGKYLYNIFFKEYSEKLWGIKCTEISSNFAAQRIRNISFFEVVKQALVSIFKKHSEKHRTLVDHFMYPKYGSGELYEKKAAAVKNNGHKIHLESKVSRIKINKDKSIDLYYEREGENHHGHFDEVISTMPLTLLLKNLEPMVPNHIKESASKLTFRNTMIVYLLVDKQDIFEDNWIYIHDPKLKTGRITNFRNWSPDLYGNSDKTILALEYWMQDEDHMWHASDEENIKLAKEELAKTGLVDSQQILDGKIYRVPKCYPIYKMGYEQHLEEIYSFLKKHPTLNIIGRYGSFKYNNQDHSILMGIMAAENMNKPFDKRSDLTKINSDYDTYQEDGKLDK